MTLVAAARGVAAPRWRLTWVAGPDAGRSTVLGPGRHVVGRSPLAVLPCEDPGLEPFHVRLLLGEGDGGEDREDGGDGRGDGSHPGCGLVEVEGTPAWCQLAGRRPVVSDGDDLEIGASVLRVEACDRSTEPNDVVDAVRVDGGDPGRPVGDGSRGRGVVIRRPRQGVAEPAPAPGLTTDESAARERPEVDLPVGSLLPAMLTLAAGGLLAVVLRQPTMLLMGAVGAIVAVATWLVAHVRRRRARRRWERHAAASARRRSRELEDHRLAVERSRRAAHPGLPGAWRVLDAAPSGLWERRPDHGDAFTVVVGIGDGRASSSDQEGAPLVLDRVPTTTELGPGARTAVAGAHAPAVIRSILVQLAVTTGPADWQLVVASDDATAWRWIAGLPQLRLTADGAAVHDEVALTDLVTAAADGRHLVIVTDAAERVAVRTGGVRRLLHACPEAALVVVTQDAVPAMCTSVWATAADGTIRAAADVHGPDGGLAAGRSRIQGLGRGAAVRAVRILSAWTDPEAADDDRHLPADASLDALWSSTGSAPDRESIARRWRAAGADAAPAAPIGIAAEGTVELDLVRDGPHALVAGTTGSGKSELLRTIVLSLASSASPEQLAFVLVDFKGGATFDGLASLPHVAGVVTDLEPRLAARVLRSLRAEVLRREHLLRDLGCPDLTAARAATGSAVVPRLVVVVDEFAALALEHPHLLHALVDVARRGRSLGVHLVLATQRPAGVVSEEIRTNTDLRIALRLHEASEAVDVVGDPTPSTIRRNAAGRAVMRLGPGDLVTFQTARPTDAARWVTEVRAAAVSLGLERARRPWCDPLPDVLPDDTDGVAGVAGVDGADGADGADDGRPRLGLVDLPDRQRQDALDWSPGDGHVLVVGSVGSGVTTALAGIAVRRLAPDAELVVIDALGDPRWDDVGAHQRCAGVVRLHDGELLDRVLRRAGEPAPAGGRLVVIDGLAVLRRELEPVQRSVTSDRLDALLLAPPTGVTLLVGNDGAGGLGPALVSRCARRFVLHLHEPGDAAVLGVRAADVPGDVPGRCHDVAGGAEGQFAGWPRTPNVQDLLPVTRVRVLADEVGDGVLPRSWSDEWSWYAPLGIAHDDLGPAVLEVPVGEHLLVVGPARSGRSEVLAGFRRCWSQARPDAAQVVIAPRRLAGVDVAPAVADAVDQVVADLADRRPVLLVVDDAELVADPGGALAALVSGHDRLLTVVVACRPDTVRSSYGHWAAALRRHRRGVLMAACDELDGDVLGAVLPRHPPVAARPGLCWLVGDGDLRLVQAARRGEGAG